jgi:Raf kinase inhibitor-like YbhB/YbcL family protein
MMLRALFLLSLLLCFCSVPAKAVPGGDMTLKLESPAFASGGAIPSRHTCEGENVSPPLVWSGAPQGTKSFVLIVDDPDAPDPAAPQMTWVHWLLFNIPADAAGLPGNAGKPPAGAREGLNDWQVAGYGGPCPPIGRHRYFHKLYALDATLNLGSAPTKAALEKAMQGHVIGHAELVGTYRKGDK